MYLLKVKKGGGGGKCQKIGYVICERPITQVLELSSRKLYLYNIPLCECNHRDPNLSVRAALPTRIRIAVGTD